ncbi:MAG: transcriptional repressor [Bacilli bacterium]|nr:transcriptional repressor [Bacilli bacterium]
MHESLLKNHGLKITSARIAVLSVLENNHLPLSAERIYELTKKEGLNLSTVYRTLNSFVEAGLVKKEINQDKESIFSLESEEDNHVLICTKCHKTVKLEGCPYHEVNEAIESQTGFVLQDHNTEIYGICPDCQNKD